MIGVSMRRRENLPDSIVTPPDLKKKSALKADLRVIGGIITWI